MRLSAQSTCTMAEPTSCSETAGGVGFLSLSSLDSPQSLLRDPGAGSWRHHGCCTLPPAPSLPLPVE